jgi:hypothetical protein
MVHNHRPDEGRGLDCPETRLPDGTLRGACLSPRIKVRKINGVKGSEAIPPMWATIYRHPTHGPVIHVSQTHADAIATTDRIRRNHARA